MHREEDLLPWILSALSMAIIAIALSAVSVQRRNLAQEPAPSLRTTALAVALPDAPPMAESAMLSEPAHALSGAPVQKIWECTIKGVKTFSDNPCGENSAIREVAPINTMTPTPLVRYAKDPRYSGFNDPRYAPTYVKESAYADEDAYSEPDAGDSYDSYPVIQGYAYLPRVRALQPHRPIHQKH